MNIITVSGSLRSNSYNSAILDNLNTLAPNGWQLYRFQGLAQLPHFHPDLIDEKTPETVRRWQNRIATADAIIISTPEYAHGIPGVLKNALDWTVASASFSGITTIALSASPSYTGAKFAHADLLETLTLIEAKLLTLPQPNLAFISKRINQHGQIIDNTLTDYLKDCLKRLELAITAKNSSSSRRADA